VGRTAVARRSTELISGGNTMRALILTLGMTLATAGSAYADGDPAKGATVFKRCAACHVVDKEQNRVGPHLVGIVGRHAGAVDGFKYSDAMKDSGLTWDEDTLDKYLADPKGFIPGNKMAFPGLKKEDEREDVIAYLANSGS
jgi:cytochrome c